MKYQIIPHEKAVILQLSGEIDSVASPILRELLDSFVQQGKVRVVIDFSEVSLINSSGLGTLVGAHLNFQRENGVIKLAGSNPRIARIVEVTRINRALEMYPNVEDALKTF